MINTEIPRLRKYYGEKAVIHGADMQPQRFLPTRFPALNNILGGGLPRGRIVEVYGKEGVEEVELAFLLAEAGSTVLYIASGAPPSEYERAGIHELYVARPDTLEEALAIAEIGASAFDVIVMDSYPAFPTKKDIETELEDVINSDAGKILARCLPRLVFRLAATGTTLIIVNQLRERTQIIYGNPEGTPGGHALRSYAALRIEARWQEHLRTGGKTIGKTVRVAVLKNKYAAPFRSVTLSFDYRRGFTEEWRPGAEMERYAR